MRQIEKEIEEYQPVNEQEEKDKMTMLSFLKENEDAFYRSNKIGHMTSSCFIVNEQMDKVLFCYHNIYDSYAWLGGHADGQEDLLSVALREAKEESSLKHIRPYDSKILSLEILCVNGHEKKGEYVSSHLHFNVTYLFIADENDPLFIKEDENSSLKWFSFSDALSVSKEPWFVKRIYPKLIEKVEKIKSCKN